MSKILISACLLGQDVRYDGRNCLQTHPRLQEWIKAGNVIAICPEMAGNLPTPRPPAEIEHGKTAEEVLLGRGKIITIKGVDVAPEFRVGAQKALELAQKHEVRVALLKADSPSCGSKHIHNGHHDDTLIKGMGVTAKLLSQHGIQVFDETEIDQALDAALSALPDTLP